MSNLQMWSDSYDRTRALLAAADPDRRVPATDAWTVRELLAHVVGMDSDAVHDRLGEPTEEVTQQQVDERAERSLPEVLAEWAELAPRVHSLLESGPAPQTAPLVVDCFWHEQDLRTALDAPAQRDDPAVQVGLTAFVQMFAERVVEAGLPTVRLTAGSFEQVAGEGEPLVHLRADPYELARALSGRRSAAQVRGFDWVGDPEPYLAVFSAFGALRSTDLAEG